MKLSVVSTSLALLAQIVSAVPTPTSDELVQRADIEKRATITDTPDVGFATQNGGTTGGKGGATTTVSTLAQFTAAVTNDEVARVIVVSGTITGSYKTRVGSNKSIIGKSGAKLVGIGLYINKSKNVIVRNLIIQKVLADNGGAVGIQAASNVWVDHVDLSSDLNNGKDYYDGLLDITHASEYVTVSNSYLHDHYKGSLVGHSDSNGDEDTGHFHVTYYGNRFRNVGSRQPSLRFSAFAHIFNNLYENGFTSGIDTRQGTQALVQNNVWVNSTKVLGTWNGDVIGYANAFGNDFGGQTNQAAVGSLTASSPPYSYSLQAVGSVAASVSSAAGATLSL